MSRQLATWNRKYIPNLDGEMKRWKDRLVRVSTDPDIHNGIYNGRIGRLTGKYARWENPTRYVIQVDLDGITYGFWPYELEFVEESEMYETPKTETTTTEPSPEVLVQRYKMALEAIVEVSTVETNEYLIAKKALDEVKS